MVHGLSCSVACGIFPEQGSNPCPCMGRRILNHCATREVPRFEFLVPVIPNFPSRNSLFHFVTLPCSKFLKLKVHHSSLTPLFPHTAHPELPNVLVAPSLEWISDPPTSSLRHLPGSSQHQTCRNPCRSSGVSLCQSVLRSPPKTGVTTQKQNLDYITARLKVLLMVPITHGRKPGLPFLTQPVSPACAALGPALTLAPCAPRPRGLPSAPVSEVFAPLRLSYFFCQDVLVLGCPACSPKSGVASSKGTFSTSLPSNTLSSGSLSPR